MLLYKIKKKSKSLKLLPRNLCLSELQISSVEELIRRVLTLTTMRRVRSPRFISMVPAFSRRRAKVSGSPVSPSKESVPCSEQASSSETSEPSRACICIWRFMSERIRNGFRQTGQGCGFSPTTKSKSTFEDNNSVLQIDIIFHLIDHSSSYI